MNAPFLGAYKTIYSSNSRTKLTFVVIKIKSFHRDSSENFTKRGNNMVCLQLEPLTNRIRTKIENWYFDPKLRIYAFQTIFFVQIQACVWFKHFEGSKGTDFSLCGVVEPPKLHISYIECNSLAGFMSTNERIRFESCSWAVLVASAISTHWIYALPVQWVMFLVHGTLEYQLLIHYSSKHLLP